MDFKCGLAISEKSTAKLQQWSLVMKKYQENKQTISTDNKERTITSPKHTTFTAYLDQCYQVKHGEAHVHIHRCPSEPRRYTHR